MKALGKTLNQGFREPLAIKGLRVEINPPELPKLNAFCVTS